MRATWFGPYPELPTGYAQQSREWIDRLATAGWELSISCMAGRESHMSDWRSPSGHVIPCYPGTPYEKTGQDLVTANYRHWESELIISLNCSWIFNPEIFRQMRTIMITPVDIEGMSRKDYDVIVNSGATPAAVCRWGEAQMRGRGLDPLYLPHGINTAVFRPPANRKKTRQAKGVDGKFVVGINAMNHERDRKNYDVAFDAFAQFHAKHPDSVLFLHTQAILPEGLDLPVMAQELGIFGACHWSDQHQLMTGAVTQEALADWYGTLDVLLMLGNEGFGLPTVEAQACGTPVIAGDWCTGPELAGDTGWLVQGQKRINNWHGKFWRTPVTTSAVAALEDAYEHAGERRKRAREAALAWDADRIWAEHWEPVFKELAG